MVRGAKLLLLKNTITMVKYLQVDTANNGNIIIALEHIMFIKPLTPSILRIIYSNAYSQLDLVSLTHAADDNSDAEVGSMADAIRKIVIDAAKGRWSDPVVNITSLLPKPITSMTLT